MKKTRVKNYKNQLGIILFSVIVIIYMFPLIITFTNSFMGRNEVERHYGKNMDGENEYLEMNIIPDKVTLSQYAELLLESPVYLNMFWNSVIITVPVVLGQIIVSTLAAYAFTVLKFKGKELLFFLYIIVMLLPLQVTMMPNFIVADWFNITDSYLAIILPGIFNPFGVFLLRQYMKSMPDAYMEAAQIDGAGHGRILLCIIIPMIKPGIITAAMLTLLDYWNLVDQAIIFIQDPEKQPLSTFLAQINNGETGLAFAGSCFYAVPMFLVLLCGKDHLKQGIAISGIKG